MGHQDQVQVVAIIVVATETAFRELRANITKRQ
jgi:hypothetical protein